jgi:hypothetical protein
MEDSGAVLIVKRRGRPPKGAEPKRASFNTRLRAVLKVNLDRAAELSGRSLSEEIEFRLEQSLDYGGPRTQEILRKLAIGAHGLGDEWLDYWFIRHPVFEGWRNQLEINDEIRYSRELDKLLQIRANASNLREIEILDRALEHLRQRVRPEVGTPEYKVLFGVPSNDAKESAG